MEAWVGVRPQETPKWGPVSRVDGKVSQDVVATKFHGLPAGRNCVQRNRKRMEFTPFWEKSGNICGNRYNFQIETGFELCYTSRECWGLEYGYE